MAAKLLDAVALDQRLELSDVFGPGSTILGVVSSVVLHTGCVQSIAVDLECLDNRKKQRIRAGLRLEAADGKRLGVVVLCRTELIGPRIGQLGGENHGRA